MALRVVFMGTPEFAIPSLQSLLGASDFEVVGVVTQPDRPAGRGNQLCQSPVKRLAQAYDIDVFQPEKLRGDDVMARLAAWRADFHVVAAYGQILRAQILELPTYGSINVHASLLPRWRGAAPIQAAIRAGDRQTGLTIMQMDPGLDTGPILAQEAIEIMPRETGESLHDKLAALADPLLVDTLRGVASGDIQPQPQDDAQATLAPRLKKEEGEIDWTASAEEIDRTVRAFYPWPGTYTYWQGELLKIIEGSPVLSANSPLSPGRVSLSRAEAPMLIGTGAGWYAPLRLQLAGRKAMPVGDFVNGFQEIDAAGLGG